MVIALLIFGFLLAMDTVYSMYYFEYSYLFELKRRFAYWSKNLPLQYQQNLKNELSTETGNLRVFIQLLYIPWAIMCLFTDVWYLPLVISSSVLFTALIYKKTYISPLMLLINFIILFSCFTFSVVYLSLTLFVN